MQTVKCLSIIQPWASLCVLGEKRIETRSWNTKYRGVLYIHASAKWNNKLYESINEIGAEQILDKAGYYLTKIRNGKITTNLPLGAIIGKVDLIDVIPTKVFHTPSFLDIRSFIWNDKLVDWSKKEEAFGDYSSNRFGWLLANPVMFPNPIFAKGKLGIWNSNNIVSM